jgi:hypothetical protein
MGIWVHSYTDRTVYVGVKFLKFGGKVEPKYNIMVSYAVNFLTMLLLSILDLHKMYVESWG